MRQDFSFELTFLPIDNQNESRLLPQLLGKNSTSRKIKIMLISISLNWFKSEILEQAKFETNHGEISCFLSFCTISGQVHYGPPKYNQSQFFSPVTRSGILCFHSYVLSLLHLPKPINLQLTSPRLLTFQHPKLLWLTDSVTSGPDSSGSLS